MQTPSAVPAAYADYDRAMASLVAAFIADPFIRWMFPDAKQYFDFFPRVLKYFAGGAFEHSSAYRSEDFKAAALWLPPGVSPDEQALGAVMQEGVAVELQEEVFGALEQVGAGHPEEAHWYLPAIGVEPVAIRDGHTGPAARPMAAVRRVRGQPGGTIQEWP